VTFYFNLTSNFILSEVMLFVADDNECTLFVKNIPWTATEDKVAELFEGCTRVRLPLNEEGRIRG